MIGMELACRGDCDKSKVVLRLTRPALKPCAVASYLLVIWHRCKVAIALTRSTPQPIPRGGGWDEREAGGGDRRRQEKRGEKMGG